MQGRIRGIALIACRDFLIKKFGSEGVKKGIKRLSKEFQDYLLKPVAEEWYPELVVVESLKSIRAEFKVKTREKEEDIIDEGTSYLINRYLKTFVKVGSPEFYIDILPMSWQFLHDTGSVEIEEKSSKRAVLLYKNFPFIKDELYRKVIVGTVKSAVKLSGVKKVVVSSEMVSSENLKVIVEWD